MKIAVCMKRVPDTATKIRVGGGGTNIDTADVQWVISPYDEYALEESIQIKDKAGDGSVTALCVGPKAAQQNVRQALAMGADAGVVVLDEADNQDPYQTAKNLAGQLEGGAYDIIFFGRLAVDSQNGQVGPLTARLLGIPCVTEVTAMEVSDGSARVEREVEGRKETVEVTLPAAFTAQKGLNEPRYASLKGIMAAKKKPIEEVPVAEHPQRLAIRSLTLPPERPAGKIVGEGVDAVPELVRLLRDEAKVL